MSTEIEDLELFEIISLGPSISPIESPNRDESSEISPILYSVEYKTAMSYLRALMAAVEFSERSLLLTRYIIDLNPAHYTVWTFRFDSLVSLSTGSSSTTTTRTGILWDELRYIAEMARDRSSKNYQLWHHRECVIRKLGDCNIVEEKLFLNEMLDQDAKNYHVWSFRQWLTTAVPLFKRGEQEFTKLMIRADPYNNSAWNHRFFVLFDLEPDPTLPSTTPSTIEKKEKKEEVEFVKGQIEANPDNASAWYYLRGMYRLRGDDESMITSSTLVDWVTYFTDSVPAQSFLLDYYTRTDQMECAKKVIERVKILDPIRSRYWHYRASLL